MIYRVNVVCQNVKLTLLPVDCMCPYSSMSFFIALMSNVCVSLCRFFVYCDCLLVCIVLILLNIDIEYELSVWMCYLALIRYLSPSGKIICCKTCVLRVKRLWKEISSTEFNKKFLLNKSPIHLKWKKSRFKRTCNLFKTVIGIWLWWIKC